VAGRAAVAMRVLVLEVVEVLAVIGAV